MCVYVRSGKVFVVVVVVFCISLVKFDVNYMYDQAVNCWG
jgi:hypothetical protein